MPDDITLSAGIDVAKNTLDFAVHGQAAPACAARSTPAPCPRRLPLEPSPEGALCPPDRPRQAAQDRPRRLPPQAPHLRQHRRPAWDALGHAAGTTLMVATLATLATLASATR